MKYPLTYTHTFKIIMQVGCSLITPMSSPTCSTNAILFPSRDRKPNAHVTLLSLIIFNTLFCTVAGVVIYYTFENSSDTATWDYAINGGLISWAAFFANIIIIISKVILHHNGNKCFHCLVSSYSNVFKPMFYTSVCTSNASFYLVGRQRFVPPNVCLYITLLNILISYHNGRRTQ